MDTLQLMKNKEIDSILNKILEKKKTITLLENIILSLRLELRSMERELNTYIDVLEKQKEMKNETNSN